MTPDIHLERLWLQLNKSAQNENNHQQSETGPLISPAKKSCIFWEFCQTVRVVA